MKGNAKCCSKINENLFLGNQFSTSVITDINVIVSIGCKSKCNLEGINNFKVSIKDCVDSDLTPYLSEVTEFIHEQLSANKRVLVHCRGGVNRSPAFVIAYLTRYNMTLEDAIVLVRTARSGARIQDHYMQQIATWLSTV